MAKLELPVHPASGAEADALANELMSAPSKIVVQAKFIYK